MSFIETILASATVSTLCVSALGWLTRSWISERLKNSIKHEYDQKLETHKAELKAQSEVEIERLKSNLSIAAKEREVVFSKLNEKRAEVIAEIYSLLVQAEWDLSSFVSPMEWVGEPKKQEKYSTAMNSAAEFYRYFDKHRIYVPENICNQLEEFIKNMRAKAIDFGVYVKYDDKSLSADTFEKKHTAWQESYKYFKQEVPKARKALEQELRSLLGDI